ESTGEVARHTPDRAQCHIGAWDETAILVPGNPAARRHPQHAFPIDVERSNGAAGDALGDSEPCDALSRNTEYALVRSNPNRSVVSSGDGARGLTRFERHHGDERIFRETIQTALRADPNAPLAI